MEDAATAAIAELRRELAETKLANEEIEKGFESLKENMDNYFLVMMGMIVYFMQAGFGFLEAGSVRHRNTTNILFMNTMVAFIGGVCYWVIGYPLSYGDREAHEDAVFGEAIGGHRYWFTAGLKEEEFGFWFFEWASCVTACTIVTGALAERLHMLGFFAYVATFTSITYPIVAHWAWSPRGWLEVGGKYNITNGNETEVYHGKFWDQGGSTVVHVVGGTTAFVACWFMGPRRGRFDKDGKPNEEIKGHSVPLLSIGAFILLFGFFAFNSGAQDKISRPGDGVIIARSCVNTVISASFAAVTGMLLCKTQKFGSGHWSIVVTINAALAGMVAICGGVNHYEPWQAALVGVGAALSYRLWATIALYVVKIDDPLEATGVHFGGGIWGTFAPAIFSPQNGILMNWNMKAGLTLGWQLAGFVAIFAWTALIAAILFAALRFLKIIRETDDNIENGQDIMVHDEDAYPAESYGHQWPDHPTLGPCRHRSVSRRDSDNNATKEDIDKDASQMQPLV